MVDETHGVFDSVAHANSCLRSSRLCCLRSPFSDGDDDEDRAIDADESATDDDDDADSVDDNEDDADSADDEDDVDRVDDNEDDEDDEGDKRNDGTARVRPLHRALCQDQFAF